MSLKKIEIDEKHYNTFKNIKNKTDDLMNNYEGIFSQIAEFIQKFSFLFNKSGIKFQKKKMYKKMKMLKLKFNRIRENNSNLSNIFKIT